MTQELFRDDSYAKNTTAQVIQVDAAGIVLDKTVFYIQGGGQPGDCGTISWNGVSCAIINTRKDRETGIVYHVPEEGTPLPEIGTEVNMMLDWVGRYALMRMHTSLHLMCAVIPHGVTGGQIGHTKSRLDFDTSQHDSPLIAEDIEAAVNRLIAENHAISTRLVDDALLKQQPEIVRTMSVAPPKNASGLLRLVQIGSDEKPVDLQPCGGTHVASTKEIGSIRIGKIENKGAKNRRVHIHLQD